MQRNRTKKLFYILALLSGSLLLAGDEAATTEPAIKPAVKSTAETTQYPLGTIGEAEPVYIKGIKTAFEARIDTGASTSSIDAQNIKPFERDGKNWVSFDIVNRLTGEKISFKKRVVRKVQIRRQDNSEHRYVVELEIKLGKSEMNREFTLESRDKFEYQALIGRNILNGMAIVDVSRKNTLK